MTVLIQRPQTIRVSRGGLAHEATLSWRAEGMTWFVRIASPEREIVEAHADDAFEALCRAREELEPDGWRLGVVGEQVDVWPSGMARDQGGGLRAFRSTTGVIGGLVDRFEPVDPATVATVSEQQAHVERLFGQPMRGPGPR